MIETIIRKIRQEIESKAPKLTQNQRSRMIKILNSDNPSFQCYGLKISEIENIIKMILKDIECTYEGAIEIFKILIRSDIHDFKFAGILLLNRFKRNFTEQTIELFYEGFSEYCDTWAICDSSCIRVIGPFLAKNDELAKKSIERWSEAERMWVRRAALVILLKIIIIKKNFDDSCVFRYVEKMFKDSEYYIQKAIGWLLRTCTNYKPDVIFKYLEENKGILPRIIIRDASEKLPQGKRAQLLKK